MIPIGCVLHTLAEEDDLENTNIVIMEPYDGPFARLLQNKEGLLMWEHLMEESEEEQARFIAAFTEKNTYTNEIAQGKSFFRISPKIKRTIKIKKNISLEHVEEFEHDVIAFFQKTPYEVYKKIVQTYFNRLLLHGIAQHHGLSSLGILVGYMVNIHLLKKYSIFLYFCYTS